jgi:Two component regulator propeller
MRRVPICFLAFLGAAAPALAQYHFDSWTTDNGLPHNSINSMLQSHEGYLWLATQRLPSECLADSGTALGLIPEATLVCRDEHNNLLLVTLESGERRLLGPAPAGFPFHLLGVRIFQDREGTLWIVRASGPLSCAQAPDQDVLEGRGTAGPKCLPRVSGPRRSDLDRRLTPGRD